MNESPAKFPITSSGIGSSFAKKRPTLKGDSSTSCGVKVRIIPNPTKSAFETVSNEKKAEKSELEKNWDKFQEFNVADDEGVESSSAKDTGTSAKVTPEN